MLIADDLNRLLKILPGFIKKPLEEHHKKKYLIEVVMDLGRRPEARFPDGPEYLSLTIISWYDLNHCIRRIGHFSGDNRAGIEYTLHRISCMKNREGDIIGLTFRVGRAVFGTISMIRDLLEKGQSLLLLGKPGVGKTTAIREIARVLADEMEKRVVIIDTSNEIAGHGDIPHPAIGRARRMQVACPEFQHQAMIEAVENHMPEVIIIDEIGTELEALAARTIAERGVQLVGTAHGNYLESLIKNPVLSDLVGGIEYVTLGDDEAKRRGSQKSILERRTFAPFQIAIEIHDYDHWIIHEQVDQSVDQILQGTKLFLQCRKVNYDTSISISCIQFSSREFLNHGSSMNSLFHIQLENKKYTNSMSLLNITKNTRSRLPGHLKSNIVNKLDMHNNIFEDFPHLKLYVYRINIQQIQSIISSLKLSIVITMDLIKADTIMALRSSIKHNNKIRQIAKSKKIIIYTIHSISLSNLTRALKQMLNLYHISSRDWQLLCKKLNTLEIRALLETRLAIEKIVLSHKKSVILLPQAFNVRQLQFNLIKSYHLKSSSFGGQNKKRIKIYPR